MIACVGGRSPCRGRLLLVVDERAAVAQRAQVVREPDARGVEIEVANVRVACVAESVHDERRDPREHPGRHGDGLVGRPEPDGQLALENVEQIGVPAMDVQVRAVAARAEARHGRVQRRVVGEDLHAPVGRVADDLAAAGRDHGRSGHRTESMDGRRPLVGRRAAGVSLQRCSRSRRWPRGDDVQRGRPPHWAARSAAERPRARCSPPAPEQKVSTPTSTSPRRRAGGPSSGSGSAPRPRRAARRGRSRAAARGKRRSGRARRRRQPERRARPRRAGSDPVPPRR